MLLRAGRTCVLLFWCATGFGSTSDPATTWNYGFKSGDHLVYRETVTREIQLQELETKTQAVYRSHVLVAGQQEGRFAIGFQRNRITASLLVYREKGKDRLSREQPRFDERLRARAADFSEANEFNVSGAALGERQVVRESSSRLLMLASEIEELPSSEVAVGGTYEARSVTGIEFKRLRSESHGAESCDVISGEQPGLNVQFEFCRPSGYLRSITYDARYGTAGGTLHETAQWQLESLQHDEKLELWILDPECAGGALRSLLIAPWLKVAPETLSAAITKQTANEQALTLGIFYRRKLGSTSEIDGLARSPDIRLARLAARVANTAKPSCAQAAPSEKVIGPPPPPGTTLRSLVAQDGSTLLYLLHVPLDYRGDEPFPLLVHLSGGAGIAMDAANAAEEAVSKQSYLVVYPHAAGRMWWQDPMPDAISAIVDSIAGTLNVDPQRIFLSGFSNGGTGAVHLASLRPRRFAAVVSLMGGATCVSEAANLHLENLVDKPVLLVHGDNDPIIPASCSKALFDDLRKLHSKTVTLHVLKDRAHDITLGSDDGLTFAFLNNLPCASAKSTD